LKRRALLGGSNLKAKRKRLSIVSATLFTAKQGVCRAECTEATADDYATGATRHLQDVLTKKMPTEKPEIFSGFIRFSPFFGTLRAKCGFS